MKSMLITRQSIVKIQLEANPALLSKYLNCSCYHDIKMSPNSSSLVSSDWEEGPLFCGGCQSHYGALQSGGGGVGEGTGLQITGQLVPDVTGQHGNKLSLNCV